MKVTRKPENGKLFIDYEVSGNKITFGDDELTVNCAKKERDYLVIIDIIKDKFRGLILDINSQDNESYIAQIVIPARTYTESFVPNPDYDPSDPESQETIYTKTANAFDIDNVELILYEEV